MAKYIYEVPEEVTFVKRNNKGDVMLEVRVSNFHGDEGVEIVQPIHDPLPWEAPHHSNTDINRLDLEEVAWLIDVLQDTEKIMQMKKEEEDGK